MQKSLTALFFSFLTLTLNCQAPFPDSKEIQQFMVSKTCVVLEDGNPAYNALIKQAVNDYWKITPFEFIKRSEFAIRKSDPSYSFLIVTETSFEKDKSTSRYNFINLIQGKKGADLNEMPEICAFPLSFAGEDDLEYGYKIEAILSFIQKHASLISTDPSQTGRRYLKYYNKNIPEVGNRTILVREEDLSPLINTIEKIKALYKYRIEIVPEEAIIKAIKEKTPKTLVLHKVGPDPESKSGYCFKMLIGTDDNELYYYNQHLIDKTNPDGLLPADLKRLARF